VIEITLVCSSNATMKYHFHRVFLKFTEMVQEKLQVSEPTVCREDHNSKHTTYPVQLLLLPSVLVC
jgi:hypothetical protein